MREIICVSATPGFSGFVLDDRGSPSTKTPLGREANGGAINGSPGSITQSRTDVDKPDQPGFLPTQRDNAPNAVKM
ncbi:MAG: hypothetical protein EPO52_06540 [Herbiconiux sp.]|nr:MAG: hypothetical protein EPO52_06540 [Herbiconiux sp.]